ncbi:MAG: putative glycosyltransferase [Gemmatimonadales bacterium]|nr:putative glycosyltransferase [Gemmatimonadales bacterium]
MSARSHAIPLTSQPGDGINPPRVTVVIPCLNEERYIMGCLDSLLANDYPTDLIEILVVDGMSDDGTRGIVREYEKKFPFIHILDNPERHTTRGLNRGITAARGDVIVRVDAHSVYDPNYITTVTLGLERHSADNVAGIRRTALIRDSAMSLALCLAISNPFTAGNAHYRIGSGRVREVDTSYCGAYRRSLFERIGLINERFNRAEDREFHARVLHAGGRIILDPSTSCTYYPRTSLATYAKWNAHGAFFLFFNHLYTDLNLIRWRNLAPAALTLVTVLAVLGVFVGPRWVILLLGLPVAAYMVLAAVVAGVLAIRHRSVLLWPAMIIVFLVTHFGYGLGTLFATPWYVVSRVRTTEGRRYIPRLRN